ncbi:MAG: hypothetical protein BroJett039_08370 [Chloroflexota bacterium]|nr:MAG: hypothetical protein BroJett039_08370 [Chloroflexota bacterium]
MADPFRTEEFRVDGDKVVGRIKELLNEGNVRRIILRTEEGKTLIEVPLTLGVGIVGAGLVFAPVLAAIGALAAMVTRLSIIVERQDKPVPPPTKTDD